MSASVTIHATGSPVDADANAHSVAVAYYRDTCAILAQANEGNRAWWYSWVSSRDVKNVAVMQRLRSIEANVTMAKACGKVVCADLRSAEETLRRLRLEGGVAVLPLSERATLTLRLVRKKLRNFHALLSEVRLALRAIKAAKGAMISIAKGGYDAVFFTIVNIKTAESQTSDHFVDDYFGALPYLITERGWKCLIVANPFDNPEKIARGLGQGGVPPVALFHAWLRPMDVVYAMVSTLLNKVDLSQIHIPSIRKLFAEEIAGARGQDMRARLLERACRRIFSASPSARIFYIYENAPWERAVYFAAHQVQSNPDLVGYMHNPVYPNNFLIAARADERQWRPDPNRIICTGADAREAVIALGTYDADTLQAGCALRLGERRDDVVVFTGKVRTILVLLSALPEMMGLLQYLDVETKGMGDEVRLVLRGHPNRSAEDIASEAGVRVGEGTAFSFCTEQSLNDALTKVDGVIYRSSGAMFAAAWRGILLFHYSGGAFDVGDPLFMRPDLRSELSAPGDLSRTIKAHYALGEHKRREKAEALARYARNYMTPPNDAEMEVFWQGMNVRSVPLGYTEPCMEFFENKD